MTKKFNRGFTLIELLVVIAIIGILSSVVLASLNTARAKGADAAIKSNINNARAQAELYYDGNSQKYAGVCAAASSATPGGILTMKTAAAAAGGTNLKCGDSDTGWAMEATLKADTTKWYCVDSSGLSVINAGTKITDGASSADVSCN
jgi:prepilin-type N-terminal cleavage/methylation domain-containing protein